MIIVTDTNFNIIQAIGDEMVDEKIINANGSHTAFAFPINSYDIDNVPSDVAVYKYCYTEADGFYLNPDYIEPDVSNTYGIPDELFNQIKADYREKIAQEVSGNGYNA